MPRKSLRPHLNQIRAWVRQGRTDAWIAHQLEVSVRDIEQFKRMNELVGDEALSEGSISPEYPEEIDLRAARSGGSRGRAREGGSHRERRGGVRGVRGHPRKAPQQARWPRPPWGI